jgi:hypothetical protein
MLPSVYSGIIGQFMAQQIVHIYKRSDAEMEGSTTRPADCMSHIPIEMKHVQTTSTFDISGNIEEEPRRGNYHVYDVVVRIQIFTNRDDDCFEPVHVESIIEIVVPIEECR